MLEAKTTYSIVLCMLGSQFAVSPFKKWHLSSLLIIVSVVHTKSSLLGFKLSRIMTFSGQISSITSTLKKKLPSLAVKAQAPPPRARMLKERSRNIRYQELKRAY